MIVSPVAAQEEILFLGYHIPVNLDLLDREHVSARLTEDKAHLRHGTGQLHLRHVSEAQDGVVAHHVLVAEDSRHRKSCSRNFLTGREIRIADDGFLQCGVGCRFRQAQTYRFRVSYHKDIDVRPGDRIREMLADLHPVDDTLLRREVTGSQIAHQMISACLENPYLQAVDGTLCGRGTDIRSTDQERMLRGIDIDGQHGLFLTSCVSVTGAGCQEQQQGAHP